MIYERKNCVSNLDSENAINLGIQNNNGNRISSLALLDAPEIRLLALVSEFGHEWSFCMRLPFESRLICSTGRVGSESGTHHPSTLLSRTRAVMLRAVAAMLRAAEAEAEGTDGAGAALVTSNSRAPNS